MATTTFDDFIAQLGKETIRSINKEKGIKQQPEKKVVKTETVARVQEPKPKIKIEDPPSQRLDEDFVEKALDYAKVIVKTVRTSFKTEEERKKVFEAIRNAVSLFLEEEMPKASYVETASKHTGGSLGSMFTVPDSSQTMTEEEFNNIPDIQEEETPVDMTKMKRMSKQSESQYNRNLKIPLKEGVNGKPEVDVNAISDKDKNELRTLMGIA